MTAAAGHEERMLVDGDLIGADSGQTFDNVNPATEEVIGQVMPDRLEGGDGAPELDALERVQARQLESRPGRADQLVRDGELAGGNRQVPIHRAEGLAVTGNEVAGHHHETEVGVEAPHRGHLEGAPFDGNRLGRSVRGAGDHDRAAAPR